MVACVAKATGVPVYTTEPDVAAFHLEVNGIIIGKATCLRVVQTTPLHSGPENSLYIIPTENN